MTRAEETRQRIELIKNAIRELNDEISRSQPSRGDKRQDTTFTLPTPDKGGSAFKRR
jgi:hypothetical protein